MVVVENTAEVHNLVVCTLCSCYPVAGAGIAAGLVQVGRLPLAVGDRSARRAHASSASSLPRDVEVRVWDSTAEVRYLVLPERPAGTVKLGEDAAGRARHAGRDGRRRPASRCRQQEAHA